MAKTKTKKTESEKENERMEEVREGFDFLKGDDERDENIADFADKARDILAPSSEEGDEDGETGDGDDGDSTGNEPDDSEGKTDEGQAASAELDAGLIERAVSLGISEDDAKAMGSNQALETMVTVVANKYAETTQANTTQTVQAQETTVVDNDSVIAVEINEDEVDESVVASFRSLEKQANEKIKALEAQVKAMNDGMAQSKSNSNARNTIQAIDPLFDSMKDEFPEVFGGKSTLELRSGSTHRSNREKVIKRMMQIHNGMVASGDKPLNGDALFRESVNGLFADKKVSVKKEKNKDTANRLAARGEQFTSRPRSRTGDSDSTKAKTNGASFEDRVAAFTPEFNRILNR